MTGQRGTHRGFDLHLKVINRLQLNVRYDNKQGQRREGLEANESTALPLILNPHSILQH